MRSVVSTESRPPGPLRLLGRAIVGDFKAAKATQLLMLLGMVLVLVYEWGPGNEAVVVSVIASVVDRYDGLGGIPLVALVAFVVVFVSQMVLGTISLTGFSMFDRTAQAAWAFMQSNFEEERGGWWTLKLSTRWALGFLLGASAVVLFQLTMTGKVGLRTHWRVVRQSGLLAGVSTAVLSALIAAAAWVARQFPATEPAANRVVGVASNPLLWIALFIAIPIIGALKGRLVGESAETSE